MAHKILIADDEPMSTELLSKETLIKEHESQIYSHNGKETSTL